jgi:hypothetical protein
MVSVVTPSGGVALSSRHNVARKAIAYGGPLDTCIYPPEKLSRASCLGGTGSRMIMVLLGTGE